MRVGNKEMEVTPRFSFWETYFRSYPETRTIAKDSRDSYITYITLADFVGPPNSELLHIDTNIASIRIYEDGVS